MKMVVLGMLPPMTIVFGCQPCPFWKFDSKIFQKKIDVFFEVMVYLRAWMVYPPRSSEFQRLKKTSPQAGFTGPAESAFKRMADLLEANLSW